MKLETMRTSQYLTFLALILVAGMAIFKIISLSHFIGAACLLSGILFMADFGVSARFRNNVKPSITRGQRTFFVLCGIVMTISGALMIWERM